MRWHLFYDHVLPNECDVLNKRHVFYWVLMDHVLRYSVDRRDCHQAKRRSKYLEIWSSRNKLAGQLLYSDKSIRFKLSGLLSQPHSAKRNQLHRRSTIAIHCLYCLCETCLVLVMWHKLWTVWEQYFLHFLTCQPQHSTYSKTLHYLTHPSGLLAVGGEQVEVS